MLQIRDDLVRIEKRRLLPIGEAADHARKLAGDRRCAGPDTGADPYAPSGGLGGRHEQLVAPVNSPRPRLRPESASGNPIEAREQQGVARRVALATRIGEMPERHTSLFRGNELRTNLRLEIIAFAHLLQGIDGHPVLDAVRAQRVSARLQLPQCRNRTLIDRPVDEERRMGVVLREERQGLFPTIKIPIVKPQQQTTLGSGRLRRRSKHRR